MGIRYATHAMAAALFLAGGPICFAKDWPVAGIVKIKAQSIECKGSNCRRQIAEGFRVMLATEVVRSRKMRVIENARLDVLLAGRKDVVGVDYLVHGTITKFGERKDDFQFENSELFRGTIGKMFGTQTSGMKGKRVTIHMAVDLKMVDTSSGRIVLADSVEGSVQQDENFAMGGITSSKAGAGPYAEVQKMVASRIAEAIVTARIPIKVVAVQKSGAIILNYGNVFLKKGDLLAVFDAGEKIVDPDTNEVLGVEETLRGTIRVTAALPKFSKAAFVEKPFPIKRGDVVRRQPAPENEPAGPSWEDESHTGD